MKKLLLILSLFTCATISFAQGPFPVKQSLGSPTTLLKQNGAIKDSLAHILARWPDTTTANINPYIKFYAGAQIVVGDDIWMRNSTATAWVKVSTDPSGSVNIYNTSGSLTGNRVLNGVGSFGLTLTNLTDFQVNDQVGTNRLQVSNVRTKLFSPLQAITFEVGDSSRWTGLQTSATTGLYIPLINPFTGAVTRTDATSIGASNNTNLGSFFRWLVPSSQGIKGAAPGLYTSIDSTTNANSLTIGADTANMFPAIRATIPSSGATSLQAVTNIGNSTDSVIISAGNISYSEYGTVWTDAFNRSSFGANYGTNGAGVTYTFPGSAYLNISGTAGSNSDYFYRLDSTNENKGSITATIVVNSKSASTAGIYIGWGGINALATNHPVFGGITLTTGSNNLFILAETAPFTYNSPQSLTINAGDTITITLSRTDWDYTISYYNYRDDATASFTLTGVTRAATLPFAVNGFSRPEFHTLGADIRVHNFSRISNESKYARNVFIGNSLMGGGEISDLSSRVAYVSVAGNHANSIISAGGGSVGSYYNSLWTADLSRYAAGAAENFWCEVSGNDSAFSVWNGSNGGRLALINLRNRVVAAGKRFIWMQPMPRNSLNLRVVADSVTAIATRLGDPLVPVFDRFNVGNALPGDFNSGDGIHLTAFGNRAWGYYIDSLLPQYTRQNISTGINKSYTVNSKNINFNNLSEWNYTLTAQTMTLPNDVNYVRINPSATLAAFTIQLPTVVDSGHIYFINFGGQLTSGVVVTGLTLNPGTGQTITRMPFTEPVLGVTALPFGVGDMIIARYLNNGRWEIIPLRTGRYTDMYANQLTLGKGGGGVATNTALGYAALYQNTSGQNNTAVGTSALTSVTTGQANTAVGSESMLTRTTASQGTTLGYFSGRTGGGIDFVAVGYAAVSAANASAARVTGVGSTAMGNLSSGSDNTAFGYGAGGGFTTGSGNTVIGANINGFATTETGTLAIGSNSLRRIWGNGRGQLILGGSIPNTGGVGTDTTSRGATVTINGTFRVESATVATTTDSSVVIEDGLFKTIAAPRFITNTTTLDFDLTAVNYQDQTVTVTGAAVNDAVSIAVDPAALVADVTYFATVTSANTVTIRCSRVGGGGAANPGSGTFRATVFKQ